MTMTLAQLGITVFPPCNKVYSQHSFVLDGLPIIIRVVIFLPINGTEWLATWYYCWDTKLTVAHS
jgi:hypothetical protein